MSTKHTPGPRMPAIDGRYHGAKDLTDAALLDQHVSAAIDQDLHAVGHGRRERAEDRLGALRAECLRRMTAGRRADESDAARAEMLKACKALLEALRTWVDEPMTCAVGVRPAPVDRCDCWACERTRESRAAIAKAEGRS